MQVVAKRVFSHIAKRIAVVGLSGVSALSVANVVAADGLWIESAQGKASGYTQQKKVSVAKGNYQTLDSAVLEERFADKSATITLAIPLPDGTQGDFTLTPSQVMSASLASRYPQFMSYQAAQVDAPKNIGRFSLTHKGLSGIYRYNGKWVLLSPVYEDNNEEYVSYYYQDGEGESLLASTVDDVLEAASLAEEDQDPQVATAQKTTGDTLITYRLALSATGEYTQAVGGTKEDAIAEMVALVNRVNQILLVDTAIQFEMVDNEDIIYTDGDTDPYTNSDSADDLATNQTVIDDAIGTDNYDIGHLLATNPGGLAYVGVVCNGSYKAQGYSGNTSPQGERFYIDLVTHELGHQLDAEHSFNAQDSSDCAEDQRSNNSAVEPGSGSTIMSYAGLCSGQNIETSADPYFHAHSVEQIRDYVETGRGATCGTRTSIDNLAPSVSVDSSGYTIPANTAFYLEASATDDDDDVLSYTWEEMDAGGDEGGTADGTEMSTDNGANPLFRSYQASALSYRYFPALADVLTGTVSFGETYPTTDRELNFRVTVKDNLGGVDTADVTLEVSDTGETFAVTQPVASSIWEGNSEENVTWNTANTQSSPISCDTVDITADLDGDNVFDTTLSSATDNDGTQSVVVPNTATTVARVMVSCSDNVFYAVNPAAFTIYASELAVAPIIEGQADLSVDENSSITLTLDDLEVTDTDSSYPDNFTLTLETGSNYTLDGNTVIPDLDFYGELSVSATVNDGVNDSISYPLVITVNAVNAAPVASDDTATVEQDSGEAFIDVLSNDSDSDGDTLSITSITYTGSSLVSINDDEISYQPEAGLSGTESIKYTVSDGALTDSATLTITVNAAETEQTDSNDSADTTSSDSGGGSLGLGWLALLSGVTFIRLRRRMQR
ncbi:reprolysin-like metallopeptidase [Alteromonas sp. C1M14]|uniref:reprolysin-like metallopeptidase n=1 Tax=Alteromonas sp. C1M14 TaxID=2841567 RepID=UPI001C0872B6|nr:zinc-dependent metalloprotease family protein [Alteromonas sp. C1M14]MBU2979306.1 cadherin-like domain-containing protein [Alteromonas sp. C1M14]